ncbi:hypothetical protein K435DRAFT_847015 [Dendrothele bispora CBS 962.96]|uniref:Zn(2)-C6 fungal-type domain-containing protein n=1 Tax=Dendrothele bispora (strain CBS 962.96) TaxID=1314807 RepID=A0A4V4HIX3_DENBC|nr:hypothetical protein K435DRAFT_847015 [Dendrothele bispora CBS 962.96]
MGKDKKTTEPEALRSGCHEEDHAPTAGHSQLNVYQKCDGAFPRCSNCERSTGRFRDCEYPGRGSSQIEYLEQQIAELESQIQERETSVAAKRTDGSIILHNPYLTPTASQVQSVWAPFQVPSTHRSEEVPLQLRQNLLSAFIPYANDLGFFLDLTKICNAILSVSSQGTSTSNAGVPPITSALMHVIFLLGSHLSTSPQVTVFEPEFLSKATGSVAHILSSTTNTSDHPLWKVLEAIQSHVLLAQYFFDTHQENSPVKISYKFRQILKIPKLVH